MTRDTRTTACTIRPATVEDAELILSFIRRLARYEKLEHEVVATEEGLRETLFGPRPAAEVLLAYLGDEPAGFALYFQNFSTFLGRPGLYIEDLYVDERHRGKGIGRALLAAVARVARQRRCGRLEWWVLDWNEPAIRFYKQVGAVPMDEWTVYRVTGEALDRLAADADQ